MRDSNPAHPGAPFPAGTGSSSLRAIEVPPCRVQPKRSTSPAPASAALRPPSRCSSRACLWSSMTGRRELTPVGAGISVWPNAVLALESLGVSGLRGGSIPRGGAGLYRWDGEPLATNAGEAIERRYGAPLVLLHRAELQQALLQALAPESIRLGETLVSFEQDDGHVTLHFADGSADSGALLVGADGLRSTVRARTARRRPAARQRSRRPPRGCCARRARPCRRALGTARRLRARSVVREPRVLVRDAARR